MYLIGITQYNHEQDNTRLAKYRFSLDIQKHKLLSIKVFARTPTNDPGSGKTHDLQDLARNEDEDQPPFV